MYEGYLEYERQLLIGWSCNFKMAWYPFGIQRCSMKFYTEQPNVVIFPEEFIFDVKGQMDLYIITPTAFCQKTNVTKTGFNGTVYEVFLERPIFGNVLTQFIPTTLFLIIR